MADNAPSPPPVPRKPRPGVAARGLVFHKGRVLLLRARDGARHAWFLPGGHVEHAELLRDAVRRELMEECALQVEPLRVLAVREYIAARHERRMSNMPPMHHVLGVVFLCRVQGAQEGEDMPGTFQPGADLVPDVVDMEWVEAARAAELDVMPPHLKRLIADLAAGREPGPLEFWFEE